MSFTAVSYTHLDVYKRQERYCRIYREKECKEELEGREKLTIKDCEVLKDIL